MDPVEGHLKRIDAEFPAEVKNNATLNSRAKKIDFLRYMRPFFGTDDATIDHFAKIRKAVIKGSPTFLHEEAASRLESIQAQIGERRMPNSGGVGWAFRAGFASGVQTLYDLHRIGMAIDYNAHEMPHLGSGKRGEAIVHDPRQLDLIAIVTGRAATMNLGVKEADLLPLLKEIGQAAMSDDPDVKAAMFGRADVIALLAKVRSEATELKDASVSFQVSLGERGDRLLEIQKEYFATSDAAIRKALVAELQTVLVPWLDDVDAAIAKSDEEIVATGFPLDKLPSGTAVGSAVSATSKLAARIAKTKRDLGKIRKPSPRVINATETVVNEIRGILGEPRWTLAAATDPTTGPATDPKALLIAELDRIAGRLTNRTTALNKKRWRDRVANVRLGLTTDATFVLGRENSKAKGKAQLETGLPSLAQLTEHGFFSVREVSRRGESFGIDFIEAAALHGFNPGARYENPDSMHFELRWQGGV